MITSGGNGTDQCAPAIRCGSRGTSVAAVDQEANRRSETDEGVGGAGRSGLAGPVTAGAQLRSSPGDMEWRSFA